jgi:hypothetical protein
MAKGKYGSLRGMTVTQADHNRVVRNLKAAITAYERQIEGLENALNAEYLKNKNLWAALEAAGSAPIAE